MITFCSELITMPNTGILKYIAKIMLGNTLHEDELAQRIAACSSLTEADVIAVLKALERELYYAILNGRPVSLGSLGTIIPSIHSETKDFEDEINEKCIKEIKINYRKSAILRRLFNLHSNGIHFHKHSSGRHPRN